MHSSSLKPITVIQRGSSYAVFTPAWYGRRYWAHFFRTGELYNWRQLRACFRVQWMHSIQKDEVVKAIKERRDYLYAQEERARQFSSNSERVVEII